MIDNFKGEFAFLSNFYPSPILMYGRRYPTVEHAFQAAKTTDATMQESIRQAQDPGRAKRLGRQVELRHDWETFRLQVMEELLRRKFSHPDLAEKLIATYPEELVEGNTWGDQFWGATKDRKLGWVGENHLGRLLMQIRGELVGDSPSLTLSALPTPVTIPEPQQQDQRDHRSQEQPSRSPAEHQR